MYISSIYNDIIIIITIIVFILTRITHNEIPQRVLILVSLFCIIVVVFIPREIAAEDVEILTKILCENKINDISYLKECTRFERNERGMFTNFIIFNIISILLCFNINNNLKTILFFCYSIFLNISFYNIINIRMSILFEKCLIEYEFQQKYNSSTK